MEYKGLFITFEGADGCGKTTQLEKLTNYLKENNIEFIVSRDPGGTELGNKLRQILLHHEGFMSSGCEMFLYLADRNQQIEEKVIPALKEGKVVILDRHIDSTVAYQGYARGLDVQNIINLNKIATNNLSPDLTLLFDVDTYIAMSRVGKRAEKDRLESEGVKFHQKVRNGYLQIAKDNPERVKVIDSNQPIDKVYEDMIKIVKGNL